MWGQAIIPFTPSCQTNSLCWSSYVAKLQRYFKVMYTLCLNLIRMSVFYGLCTTYLSTVTGATGQDLLDLKTRAVLSPPTNEPICGALVRFRDFFTPHKWRLRWGICSDPERCPFLENCSSLAEISCCTFTVAGNMVARVIKLRLNSGKILIAVTYLRELLLGWEEKVCFCSS